MGEGKKVFYLFVLLILLAFLGIFLSKRDIRVWFSDLYADYTAYFYISDDFFLKEDYVYYPEEGKFKMLYRVWRVPLVYNEELNKPFIRLDGVDSDKTVYLKDWRGEVHLLEGIKEREIVKREAERNEVGIVKLDKFTGKRETLSISYYVYPPVNDDGNYQHINIKLGDKHIFYKSVILNVFDEAGIVEYVYPHFPYFRIERKGNIWKIEGKAPADTLLELEVLMKGLEGMHFYTEAASVKRKVEKENETLIHYMNLRNSAYDFMYISLLLFPFVYLLIYRLFGKEAKFTVPKFISFVPNSKRKPWIVNMIFSGDATVTDENAYYSTLLDLERRGFIKIIEEGDDVRIRVLRMDTDDKYERKILIFLTANTDKEGFFSVRNMEDKVKEAIRFKDRKVLENLKRQVDGIYRFSDRGIYSGVLDLKGFYLMRMIGGLTFISVLGVIIYLSLFKYIYIYDIVVMGSFLIAVANIPHILLPSQILGRWKSDLYKERLEWEAFKRFLSDLAMLEKYGKEDLSLWKEWIYYGTALGVAENIEKVMSSLKINVPEIRKVSYIRRRDYLFYKSLKEGIKSFSSGSGKGGFGVGSGFGGGGAGGR